MQKEVTTDEGEQIGKVLWIASLGDMQQRTKEKLLELWKDWMLWKETQVQTVSLLPTIPVPFFTPPVFPPSFHFLISGLLNLHLEGVCSREALAGVLSAVLAGNIDWVREAHAYLLLGLAWTLCKEQEQLTLEELMMQMCTQYVPSVFSLSQREIKLSHISRSLLPHLSSISLPSNPKTRYLFEEARSAIRQNANPAAFKTLSDMNSKLKAMRGSGLFEREVKGIRTYQGDNTSWASRCANVHSPIQTKTENVVCPSSSFLITGEMWQKGESSGPVHRGSTKRTTADDSAEREPKSRERPKTAGTMPRSRSVNIIRPQSSYTRPTSSLQLPLAQTKDLQVVGVRAAIGPSPCLNQREHLIRVLSKEATPWVAYKWKGQVHRMTAVMHRGSVS